MADAPAPPKGGGPLAVITRKVGPLPVWAYAALLVVAYYLYRRSHPSASTPASTPGVAQSDQAYVPPFDAAGAGGGGGIGSTATPGVVNNYYYGDTAAQQAAGGGTAATGVGSPSGTTEGLPSAGDIHGFGPGGPVTYVRPPVVAPAQHPISYYVPASGRQSAGTAV